MTGKIVQVNIWDKYQNISVHIIWIICQKKYELVKKDLKQNKI